MSNPIVLRDDFNAAEIHNLARGTRDPSVRSRLLAIASVYEGGSRTEAALLMGVGRQVFRDWVLRFNAQGPSGLESGRVGGVKTPSLLGEALKLEIAELVNSSAAKRGRRLNQSYIRDWLADSHGIIIGTRILNDELRTLREVGRIPKLDYTFSRVY